MTSFDVNAPARARARRSSIRRGLGRDALCRCLRLAAKETAQ